MAIVAVAIADPMAIIGHAAVIAAVVIVIAVVEVAVAIKGLAPAIATVPIAMDAHTIVAVGIATREGSCRCSRCSGKEACKSNGAHSRENFRGVRDPFHLLLLCWCTPSYSPSERRCERTAP